MTEIIIEPAGIIPDVYMWEVVFNNRQVNGVCLKKRIRAQKAVNAVAFAQQELRGNKDKLDFPLPVNEVVLVRLVDAYRDNDFPEKECYREGCNTKFRGGGVYCSHNCAVSDSKFCDEEDIGLKDTALCAAKTATLLRTTHPQAMIRQVALSLQRWRLEAIEEAKGWAKEAVTMQFDEIRQDGEIDEYGIFQMIDEHFREMSDK